MLYMYVCMYVLWLPGLRYLGISNRCVHSIAETSCPPCSVAVALRAIGDASLFRDYLPAMLCSSVAKDIIRVSGTHGGPEVSGLDTQADELAPGSSLASVVVVCSVAEPDSTRIILPMRCGVFLHIAFRTRLWISACENLRGPVAL